MGLSRKEQKEILAKKLKEQQEYWEAREEGQSILAPSGGTNGEAVRNSGLKAEDLAPVRPVNLLKSYGPGEMGFPMMPSDQYFAMQRKMAEEAKKRKEKTMQLLQKGAFSDGFQLMDIPKVILGTAADAGLNALQGLAGMAEGLWDAGQYGLAGLEDALGFQEDAEKRRKSASRNATEGGFDGAKTWLDQYSVMGDTSEGFAQMLGQMAVIMATGGAGSAAGLGAKGVTALTTGLMGASSFGSSTSEAYQSGAKPGEAEGYGAIAGIADAVTETFFSGLGKSVKAVGLSKSGIPLDDMLAKKVSQKFQSQIAKNLAEYGIKSGAEGTEEVMAGIAQAVGKKMTYMKEEDFLKILEDEQLLEQFVVGSVNSGMMQSGYIPGTKNGSLRQANQAGVDFITGMTANEQAVVDLETKKRIAEAEKEGKSLSKKDKGKIQEQVERDLERGEISTDTIEEVLGGETYQQYKKTADQEDALRKEFDQLNQMKQGDMTGEQIDRRNELKKKLAELEKTSQRQHLKDKLGQEVRQAAEADRLGETYLERDRRGEAFQADGKKYSGKQAEVVQKAVDSGLLNNTRKTHDFVDLVAKIASEQNVSFDFSNNEKLKQSGFALEGKIINGVITKEGITLNVQSKKALNQVVGHEIAHVLEGSELYQPLQEAIIQYAKKKGDFQSRMDEISEIYKNVKDADVTAELTADLVGEYLFTDTDFIRQLSTENRNVFQRIYDEVKHLATLATAGSQEARELEKVKRAFDKAYRESGRKPTTESSVKYSLSQTTDGRIAAVVDSDILSNIDTSSWDNTKKAEAKKAASEALKNFRDGIVVNGVTRNVNRQSWREYTRSNDTERLYARSPDVFADKMRAAEVADDVVVAATNWSRDGGLKHPRNDDFADFDHGTTLIVSGNAKYIAEVVVGITNTGEAVFYDVVNMTPTTFDIKKEESPTTATTQNAIGDIQGDSSLQDSIVQSGENVNPSGENISESAKLSLSNPTEVSKDLAAPHNSTDTFGKDIMKESMAARAEETGTTGERPASIPIRQDAVDLEGGQQGGEKPHPLEGVPIRQDVQQSLGTEVKPETAGTVAQSVGDEPAGTMEGVPIRQDVQQPKQTAVQETVDKRIPPQKTANKLKNRPAAQGVAVEDLGPVQEVDGKQKNPDGQQAFMEDAGVDDRIARQQLHQGIVDRIKDTFREKGFDFDEVLKKAKNLATFRTVDNTPQRVMEKTLGYAEGNILSDLTVNKVAQNESEGIRWLNGYLGKGGALREISADHHIKPGSKESAAAQMYAEGFYVGKNQEIISYGDLELAADFPDKQVQRNIKALAQDPRIRQIYDETLQAINESRKRNLYPEIPRLDNYFLHFRAMDDTYSELGLPFNPNDIKAKDLPTDLNGVTADLKPGQPYFASAMHRMGKRTSFDLLGGLERYLTSAKNQIYHIDDIQTLRALRNYIAETYGQATGLAGLDGMSAEEVGDKIRKVYNSHLSTFAKFLNEEANVLAGKTALIDRGIEGICGRRGITFLNDLNRQVGSNMVGWNVGSALTNSLAGFQAFAKTNKTAFVQGFIQTVADKINHIYGRSDGFAESNPTILRRKGAERFYRTPWQKATDAGYVLAGIVDDFTTEVIVRSKVNELTQKGMSRDKAIVEADKWTSRLMGDRSLGQQPQLYNSKLLGMFTKFQLEVRNQLDSMIYDTVQEAKTDYQHITDQRERNAKTAAKAASVMLQLAAGQHLFGSIFEAVAGYNPAFDIIEVLMTTLGFDDEEDSEDTALDNLGQGALALVEDMPYTSMLTGGRVPIASALPIRELMTGKDDYGRKIDLWSTLADAAHYALLPGGYGQAKKTYNGLKMFDEDLPMAGSYTNNGDLRFPVEKTPLNVAQAAVFGQWANPNAREYFDQGWAPMKPHEVQEFQDLGIPMRDYQKIREDIGRAKDKTKEPEKGQTLSDKAAYVGELPISDAQKSLIINNRSDREKPIDMRKYKIYADLEEMDFATKQPKKYRMLKLADVEFSDYQKYKEAWEDMDEWYDKADYIARLPIPLKQRNAIINTISSRDDPIDLTGYENYPGYEAFDYAKSKPGKYLVSVAAASDLDTYKGYTKELNSFKGTQDENGDWIPNSKKRKIGAYIDSLNIGTGQKMILYKEMYKSDHRYDDSIFDYVNGLQSMKAAQKVELLEYLGFQFDEDGYWIN